LIETQSPIHPKAQPSPEPNPNPTRTLNARKTPRLKREREGEREGKNSHACQICYPFPVNLESPMKLFLSRRKTLLTNFPMLPRLSILYHTTSPPTAYTPPPRGSYISPQKEAIENNPRPDLTDVEKEQRISGDETLPHSTNAGRHHNSTNDNTQTMYLTQRRKKKKKPSNQTKGYRDDDPLRKVHTPTPVSHQSAIYAVTKHRI
jgi:hypothetical protein